jgi:galactose mutarotase-like enzyme
MITLYNRTWTRAELLEYVGRIDQIAGICAGEITDGAGRGMRTLDVYTGGGLNFRVLPDRALDIAACRYRELPLAWESPAGEVHPAFYQPDGVGWLRTFGGGLLATCGLDQFGAPNTDQGESFGLHGRIGATPAHHVSIRAAWHADDYVLEITGVVEQARLFGEHLRLTRTVRTQLGSTTITLHDTVQNMGYAPQPHLILYHFNFGFPLISADTRLELPVSQTLPRDADADAGLGAWSRFQTPTPAYREQVFHHVLTQGRARLVNPTLDLSVELRWDPTQLPHLFQWKMMGQGAYVCGIEPANSSAIHGRAHARTTDDLPLLQPGEIREYQLALRVESG